MCVEMKEHLDRRKFSRRAFVVMGIAVTVSLFIMHCHGDLLCLCDKLEKGPVKLTFAKHVVSYMFTV
jgi:hypothetical protein